VKFLSRLFTVLNLLPSIATLACGPVASNELGDQLGLRRREQFANDTTISQIFGTGMNAFARDLGTLQGDVVYEQIVAPQLRFAAG
jgi:hypothetical protein